MSTNNNQLVKGGVLVIIGILIGMFANNLIMTASYTVPDGDKSAKRMDKDVRKALEQNGKLPEVVFALTKNGSLQAFVPEGANVIEPKFPLHAGNILSLNNITLYSTSNPKICWASLGGHTQCVSW